MLEQATQVSIVVLLVGIAYQAGQHSQKIAGLLEWRAEFVKSNDKQFDRFMKEVTDKLEEIKREVKTLIQS